MCYLIIETGPENRFSRQKQMATDVYIALTLQLSLIGFSLQYTAREEDPLYWRRLAQDELLQSLSPNIVGPAKNVILFIGDGMSLTTVTTARILNGQLGGRTGEETRLSWEYFQHTGLAKTYNHDYQTPDSAGTATAFLCGVKTNKGVIGFDARVKRGNEEAVSEDTKLNSIMDWSKSAGKSVGIVTTTRVTHATPAAAYAHVPSRSWEGDRKIPQASKCCKDIARQLIEDNGDVQVILGGGRQYFMTVDQTDPERGQQHKGRQDGRDLIQYWREDKISRNQSHQYVWNIDDFKNVDPTKTDYLLGLFEQDHMQFDLDRNNPVLENKGEPSIAEMTEKAIRILQKNTDGFFLFVEGGRIDHAHHASKAGMALYETIALSKAVAVANQMTDIQDTLIIVTADHGHAFTMTGYPSRGNPILGKVDNGVGGFQKAGDSKPYTTLLYGIGPGYETVNGKRPDISSVNTSNENYVYQSAVEKSSETHSGEDVPIYARGPMSHLLSGVHEQHYIAHVMALALCVGDYGIGTQHCKKKLFPQTRNGSTSYKWSLFAMQSLLISSFFIAL